VKSPFHHNKLFGFMPAGWAIIFICIISMLSSLVVCDELKNNDVAMLADNEWRFLSFRQKHSQMTFLIHPTMMEHFQAFYKTPTPELTCASCHGENAESAGYELSNSTPDALKASKVQALYRQGAALTPEQLFKRDSNHFGLNRDPRGGVFHDDSANPLETSVIIRRVPRSLPDKFMRR
jgi:hypothetical protein